MQKIIQDTLYICTTVCNTLLGVMVSVVGLERVSVRYIPIALACSQLECLTSSTASATAAIATAARARNTTLEANILGFYWSTNE